MSSMMCFCHTSVGLSLTFFRIRACGLTMNPSILAILGFGEVCVGMGAVEMCCLTGVYVENCVFRWGGILILRKLLGSWAKGQEHYAPQYEEITLA